MAQTSCLSDPVPTGSWDLPPFLFFVAQGSPCNPAVLPSRPLVFARGFRSKLLEVSPVRLRSAPKPTRGTLKSRRAKRRALRYTCSAISKTENFGSPGGEDARKALECGSLLPLSLRPACWPPSRAPSLDARPRASSRVKAAASCRTPELRLPYTVCCLVPEGSNHNSGEISFIRLSSPPKPPRGTKTLKSRRA